MAKKAGGKSTTVSLAEALAQLAEHYPQHIAGEKLNAAMAAAASEESLQCEFDGPRAAEGDPKPADVLKRLTGQGDPQLHAAIMWPTISCAESSIEYHTRHGRCTLYRIRLPREVVERFLPEPRKPKPAPERKRKPRRRPGRGRRPFPVWEEIFQDIDAEVRKGKRFPSQGSAVERVITWLNDHNKTLSESAIKRGIRKHRPWWWGGA